MLTGVYLLLAATLGGEHSPPSDTALVISNVAVLDVLTGASQPDQRVLIRGSRIELVAPARDVHVPRDARIVDGAGKHLIPGLWDMHVHLGGDELALQMLLASGVTGIREMGGDLGRLAEIRRRLVAGQPNGPRLVFAGPMLRGPKSSSDTSDAESLVIRTPDEGRRAVDSLAAQGVDFVKVHEDLSQDTLVAIVTAARGKRLPCVGHVPAGVTPIEASDLGLLSIEHLEFVPDSCLLLFDPEVRATHATPPEACGVSALATLLRRLAQNGTWLDPTIGSFRYWAPKQWDAIFAGFRDMTGEIRGSRVQILAGTDWSHSLQSLGAPPGGSLHDELALLVQAGFSPTEALRAATWNPARFLGLSGTLGTVESGKTADLLLLEGDPLQDIHNTRRVAAVIREGRYLSVHDGSLLSTK